MRSGVTKITLPLGILAQSRRKVRRTLLLGNSRKQKKFQALSLGRTRKAYPQRNEKNNPVIKKSL
jgi:hypothetical protein